MDSFRRIRPLALIIVLMIAAPARAMHGGPFSRDRHAPDLLWDSMEDFLRSLSQIHRLLPDQAQGAPWDGSLKRASRLPDEGEGYLKILRPRDRAWAAEKLIELIAGVSAAMSKQYSGGERLQLGDFSQREGGRITRHGSHQNGLDVDGVYLRRDHREQDWGSTDGFDESFVSSSRVTPNFDLERNWRLMELLVASGTVNRIFVDPAIKGLFCRYASNRSSGDVDSNEVLRRLRPYQNHHDHFHLRVRCPGDSPHCVDQIEPPAGAGCRTLRTAI